MSSQMVLSIALQLVASAVLVVLAYLLMRWLGQPLQGDDQAKAALNQVRRLNRYAREQSQRIIQRQLH
jgi:hypothetical protein